MTKQIIVGGVPIGGGAPLTVQSMTTTKTADAEATAAQIRRLEAAGCDIVRVAVPDEAAARAIADIKKQIAIPLVADIHFDYRLALIAAEHGADKIRINPGNIGSADRVRAVADACRERSIPIRIGVNSGSVNQETLTKYGGVNADSLCESALGEVRQLEDAGFSDICVSIKASSVPLTIACCRRFSALCDYPQHIGVTETGSNGVIKSAIGIGTLLALGIGDTLRVSLTDDPVEEVKTGIAILKSLGLRGGVDIVSCPTCGRCKIDLIPLAREVERRTAGLDRDLKIAVMGCAVNGPGEARDADCGIAGGDGMGLVFRKGEIVGRAPYDCLVDELMKQIIILTENVVK
jgi:(E)-4-hydroxy-3-methylbut-2-enyl-diphosphate synthase